MKSTLENLSPTRVRLAVEVPFEELTPALDNAYREIAQQVRIPGFRPGHAPARLIDQRVGRGAVLQEAVNEAIPEHYTNAVREHDLKVVSQPDVEVSELDDGQVLTFTAEVDIRPDATLPAYDSLSVVVDAIELSEDEIDEQLTSLRERFATLTGVERPVGRGDYVSIDLHATVDGADVEGGTTTGMSYEVGSDNLIPGADDALEGMSAGESATFQTELAGAQAGKQADVEVTVRAVKEKELPEVDDDFAQTASEFDTITDLRADVRARLERGKRLEQAYQARDRIMDALADSVELPVPDSLVEAELAYRRQTLEAELAQAQMTMEAYLESESQTAEQFDTELREATARAVKLQLLLDTAADNDEIGVDDQELTQELIRRAQQGNVAPDALAQQMMDNNQLPMLAADVRRAKALALMLEAATVTDAAGDLVDLKALQPDGAQAPADGDEATADEATAEEAAAEEAAADDDNAVVVERG